MLVPKRSSRERDRICPADVRGPSLVAGLLSQEVRDLVRKLELGEEAPKPLVVDSNSNVLVASAPLGAEEVLENVRYYLAYRLGEFSSVPGSFLPLTTAEKAASRSFISKLVQDLGEEEEEVDEEEEDYPEEDDTEPPYDPEEEDEGPF